MTTRNSQAFGWLAVFAFTLIVNVGFVSAQDEPAIKQPVEAKQDNDVDLDELVSEAIGDARSENFSRAIKKFEQYFKSEKDNDEAWFLYGYALHMSGKLDDGIKAFKSVPDTSRFYPTALFNLGCAYSLKNEPETSLKYLHDCLDAGFNQFDFINDDEDLTNVRKSEGFQEIKARVENNGQRPKKKFDAKSLVGDWAMVAGTRQGDEVAADRLPTVVFTAKDVTIPTGDDEFVMSYKIIDASKDIIELDFKIESGPSAEGNALAILKVEGDKAKLCYDPTGQKRPTGFKTTKADGNFSFVLEKKAKKFDATKIVGVWNVTQGMRAGEKVAAERLALTKITFEKDSLTIPVGEDGGEEFVMSYKIKSGTSPVQIDMAIESGPAPEGSPALGIVKFEGEKFIICYNAEGGDRPDKFESTTDNGNFLFTMEAVKK